MTRIREEEDLLTYLLTCILLNFYKSRYKPQEVGEFCCM